MMRRILGAKRRIGDRGAEPSWVSGCHSQRQMLAYPDFTGYKKSYCASSALNEWALQSVAVDWSDTFPFFLFSSLTFSSCHREPTD